MMTKTRIRLKAIQVQKARFRWNKHLKRLKEMMQEYSGVCVDDAGESLHYMMMDKLEYPNVQGEITIKDVNDWLDELQS